MLEICELGIQLRIPTPEEEPLQTTSQLVDETREIVPRIAAEVPVEGDTNIEDPDPGSKTIYPLKIPIFNREYIFNRSIFQPAMLVYHRGSTFFWV